MCQAWVTPSCLLVQRSFLVQNQLTTSVIRLPAPAEQQAEPDTDTDMAAGKVGPVERLRTEPRTRLPEGPDLVSSIVHFGEERCSLVIFFHHREELFAFVDALLNRNYDAGKGKFLVSLRHENRSGTLLSLDMRTFASRVPDSCSFHRFRFLQEETICGISAPGFLPSLRSRWGFVPVYPHWAHEPSKTRTSG